jgi:hypothetical protein
VCVSKCLFSFNSVCIEGIFPPCLFVSCYYRFASPLMTEKLRDKFSDLQTFRHIKNYFRVPSVEERLENTDLGAVKKHFCVF